MSTWWGLGIVDGMGASSDTQSDRMGGHRARYRLAGQGVFCAPASVKTSEPNVATVDG